MGTIKDSYKLMSTIRSKTVSVKRSLKLAINQVILVTVFAKAYLMGPYKMHQLAVMNQNSQYLFIMLNIKRKLQYKKHTYT